MTQSKTTHKFGISSFTLHILAMVFMVIDHLCFTVVAGQDWMAWVGRLAFPIFAFMIAEGYSHTRNVKKYMKRMLIFALLSEIPYNLLTIAFPVNPFQQNVLWTFLLALLCMSAVDRVRAKYERAWLSVTLSVLVIAGFYLLATLLFVDYKGMGLLTVLLFYFLRGDKHYHRILQAVAMVLLHIVLFKGQTVTVPLPGIAFEMPLQGISVLSLIPIWLYNGTRGYDNKVIRFVFYAFYPVHMLILGLLSL